MTRIGVVGNPGAWSSERLADAVEDRTGFRRLVDPAELTLDTERGCVREDGEPLGELDALLVKKIGEGYRSHYLERLELLGLVEECGTPVFSPPGAISRAMDRLTCTLVLQCAGAPLPPTVVTEDPEEAAAAVERFGEAVLKPLFTSKGRGMRAVEPGPDLMEELEAFRDEGNPMIYVQQLVEHPGWDLGIAFLDGEHVGTYARRAADPGSWKTTGRSGAGYAAFDPDPEIVELARDAQAPFGLDFTSVDVVLSEMGPMVWEVSAFGGFRGLWETRRIDAAERYVEHVLERIERDA